MVELFLTSMATGVKFDICRTITGKNKLKNDEIRGKNAKFT